VGEPLSPYAATKATKELYARVFARTYNIHVTGLRYFNVFGPRQNPDGDYAAVIPRWIKKAIASETIEIFGDGETSRDFCYIANAVQANIMAAYHGPSNKSGEIYNIAAEKQTTLNRLYELIAEQVQALSPSSPKPPLEYKDFRPGDVRHSLASVAKTQKLIGYQATHSIEEGLVETMQWYFNQEDA
jgi:UDP-N-acetylglucosamine/UDP-N-acetylgalactosamine 4-epimerase